MMPRSSRQRGRPARDPSPAGDGRSSPSVFKEETDDVRAMPDGLVSIRRKQGTRCPLVRVDYAGTVVRGRLARADSDPEYRRGRTPRTACSCWKASAWPAGPRRSSRSPTSPTTGSSRSTTERDPRPGSTRPPNRVWKLGPEAAALQGLRRSLRPRSSTCRVARVPRACKPRSLAHLDRGRGSCCFVRKGAGRADPPSAAPSGSEVDRHEVRQAALTPCSCRRDLVTVGVAGRDAGVDVGEQRQLLVQGDRAVDRHPVG